MERRIVKKRKKLYPEEKLVTLPAGTLDRVYLAASDSNIASVEFCRRSILKALEEWETLQKIDANLNPQTESNLPPNSKTL